MTKNNSCLLDMRVVARRDNGKDYTLLRLRPESVELPEMLPGQFVNVLVPAVKEAFLRRPISINDVDYKEQTLSLLIKDAGPGTHGLCACSLGNVFNVLLPLGKGFTLPVKGEKENVLLVGGGVGTAPLLYLGRKLKERGMRPKFLLGARTADELMQLDSFRELGEVVVATEDGSAGVRGFVTHAPEMTAHYDHIYVCGPMPMMKAVASMARESGSPCEVSLENRMACGLGACLCCVEDTVRGNECTCTAGPVFDINDLKW